MPKTPWTVHKFGGTSVKNAERYRAVWEILKVDPVRPAGVVVSAMKGITDDLLDLITAAEKAPAGIGAALSAIRQRHETAARELLPATDAESFQRVLVADLQKIEDLVKGISHTHAASPFQREWVSGHGEVWSAQLLHLYLTSQGQPSHWLDAREVLVVTPHEHHVTVDWKTSQARLDKWLAAHPAEILVITGFVASTAEGIATTLKRNGSDYSASIFGRLLKASAITIWTDVDGVLSADPRLVPQARWIPKLSYSEATELAYFGAKVVHPSTMAPAIADGIPIWIRNSFAPEKAGSLIHSKGEPSLAVCGFASIDDVALLNVEGPGMIGVPGVAERLFGALRSVGVSVILISQASSEHSICFAVPLPQAKQAEEAARAGFRGEILAGEIDSIRVDAQCSVLAAVGDNMALMPGVSGKFFSALGKARVNVKAIAQGSSERNISAVVEKKEIVRALRAVHTSFMLSPHTLAIGLIGTGNVGKTFLRLIEERRQNDTRPLRVLATSNSREMTFFGEGHATGRTEKADVEKLAHYLLEQELPNTVLVDLTSSEDIAALYPRWFEKGLHVVTANKKLGSGDWSRYQNARDSARASQRNFHYETTVGGGLPVLRTLRDMLGAGDKLHRLEGILSGTLSYLFNNFDGRVPFSELVGQAQAAGLTEPDPKDDLSGTDVARKLVILGREAGHSLSLSDIDVESLVGKPDTFWQSRLEEARAKKSVLRYVARLDEKGKGTVRLESIPQENAMAHLRATDNLIAFSTERYSAQPLVIQGPGAGPLVTASGVLSDCLRLLL